MSTPIAIIQQITLANGSFKFMKGLTRGYIRVDIIDPSLRKTGTVKINHKAHLGTIYQSAAGLFGVTERSRYELHSAQESAERIAAEWNAEQRV